MIQAEFMYDLFDRTKGRLTIQYDIFEKVTEQNYLPVDMVQSQVEARIKNLICDKIEKLRNQRSENYRYGAEHWKEKASNALFYISARLPTARRAPDLKKFANYIKDQIRPLLDDIKPGEASVFHKNYCLKLQKLDSYLNYMLENPGFTNLLEQRKINKKSA